ncbi:HNH endonuclease [Haloarchaeobius iranensis]|uniref:Putative restriction endonuclease n=1 Tax=Haloarchaeobius iranensis TaxID=996166 RepID=A0A1H0A618_9EURY|nr:HNH endonuclease signature motif containing protein [Haloarchaeobius iranensis]SDN28857.1 putative restriction endonuclease [Haloarchaeobius iranensis]
MQEERVRSIVPMFGGATRYVETLDAILAFVDAHKPSTDELVGWHRGQFDGVSSEGSIMRRVRYLRKVGFLAEGQEGWTLGPNGEAYTDGHDTATLLRIMCDRNVGLRSLLYALAVGPMTIAEIGAQQLDTHPELGWDRNETGMPKQRANWLRSMGLVEKRGDEYALTDEGREFVEGAVADWAGTEWTVEDGADDAMTAGTYETTAQARSVDPEFRATALSRYERTCPVSGVDHTGLLDVAHVLPWSEYPAYRADLSNVLVLDRTHHAAFDRELFTLDEEYRLVVNPGFETESELLERTILNRDGERVGVPEEAVDAGYLRQHNAELAWV